jgi:hypothetical protein
MTSPHLVTRPPSALLWTALGLCRALIPSYWSHAISPTLSFMCCITSSHPPACPLTTYQFPLGKLWPLPSSPIGSMAPHLILIFPTGLAGLWFDWLAPFYLHWFPACSLLITLLMEAVQTSETVVNLYQSSWHYNPSDSHLHSKKLKLKEPK